MVRECAKMNVNISWIPMNMYDYQNLHNTYTHAFIMDTVIRCPWELKKPQPSVVNERCCLLKSHGSWWELGQRKCVVTRWLASLDWTPQARKHGESARRRVPQWTNCRSTQSFLQEWAVHLTGAGMPLFDFEWAGNQSNMIYTPPKITRLSDLTIQLPILRSAVMMRNSLKDCATRSWETWRISCLESEVKLLPVQ